MKKLSKLVMNNIILTIIIFLTYLIILFNIPLAIIFTLSSVYIIGIYSHKKLLLKKERSLDFQINSFIKNMAINSLANNFNIIDSVDKSADFIEGKFKKDLYILNEEIKMDYDYEKAFMNLGCKYKKNRILKEFLENILIIKEQSNVEESAKKIFEIASKDSQKYIVRKDRIQMVKESNFKNYLINVALGYLVSILIVISLNSYYIVYAKKIEGIILNSSMIILVMFITLKFINEVYKGVNNDI
jgi:hypothetical protein